ncbi:MAG: hypothetical protein AB7P23_11680 [Amphiplicatus sp.]
MISVGEIALIVGILHQVINSTRRQFILARVLADLPANFVIVHVFVIVIAAKVLIANIIGCDLLYSTQGFGNGGSMIIGQLCAHVRMLNAVMMEFVDFISVRKRVSIVRRHIQQSLLHDAHDFCLRLNIGLPLP